MSNGNGYFGKNKGHSRWHRRCDPSPPLHTPTPTHSLSYYPPLSIPPLPSISRTLSLPHYPHTHTRTPIHNNTPTIPHSPPLTSPPPPPPAPPSPAPAPPHTHTHTHTHPNTLSLTIPPPQTPHLPSASPTRPSISRARPSAAPLPATAPASSSPTSKDAPALALNAVNASRTDRASAVCAASCDSRARFSIDTARHVSCSEAQSARRRESSESWGERVGWGCVQLVFCG